MISETPPLSCAQRIAECVYQRESRQQIWIFLKAGGAGARDRSDMFLISH